MAEAPESPFALAAALNDSSSTTASTDGTSMDVANILQNAAGTGVDLQCPATPQLRIKLPELSSSSSDSENDEHLAGAEASASTNNALAEARREGAASPPPNCAICLGRCKNKCFTDSCMHQFCFKCLCEWSKVKPECPLCKQTFKSIIHNVKSIDQFEEYHVQPAAVSNFRNDYDPLIAGSNWVDGPRARVLLEGRIFYPFSGIGAGGSNAAAGGGGALAQNQVPYSELLEMYRQEYPDLASSGTLSQLWRRYVYDRKLYALPVCDITGRFRECSARFYRDNPAQIHRLMPWINRDIICLLRNTEHDVSTVLERINSSLTQMSILSPTFRRRLQPYLGTRTSHFIHELNNFARSPYDCIGYDRAVQYSPHTAEEIVIEFSSSGSSGDEDQQQGTNQQSSHPTASTSSSSAGQQRRRRDPGELARTAASEYRARGYNQSSTSQPHMVNLLSFTISTTSEGAEAPGVTVAVSGGRGAQSTAINLTTHNRDSEFIVIDDTETDAAQAASSTTSAGTPAVVDNIELSSGSSDECEFVLERKPPHLRTPEMVSLNSESDSDVVFVNETIKTLRDTAFSTSEDEGVKEKTSEGGRIKRASAAAAAAANASIIKNERDLAFNMGASTSTGLRSGGALDGERRKSLRRQQRRKRNSKSDLDRERGGYTATCENSAHSSTPVYSSDASSEVDSNWGNKKRQRNVGRKRTARTSKGARDVAKSRNKRRNLSQGSATMKRQKRNFSSRAVVDSTEDELDEPLNKSLRSNLSQYSSSEGEEDDSLTLTALMKRLAEDKKAQEELTAAQDAPLSKPERAESSSENSEQYESGTKMHTAMPSLQQQIERMFEPEAERPSTSLASQQNKHGMLPSLQEVQQKFLKPEKAESSSENSEQYDIDAKTHTAIPSVQQQLARMFDPDADRPSTSLASQQRQTDEHAFSVSLQLDRSLSRASYTSSSSTDTTSSAATSSTSTSSSSSSASDESDSNNESDKPLSGFKDPTADAPFDTDEETSSEGHSTPQLEAAATLASFANSDTRLNLSSATRSYANFTNVPNYSDCTNNDEADEEDDDYNEAALNTNVDVLLGVTGDHNSNDTDDDADEEHNEENGAHADSF